MTSRTRNQLNFTGYAYPSNINGTVLKSEPKFIPGEAKDIELPGSNSAALNALEAIETQTALVNPVDDKNVFLNQMIKKKPDKL